MKPQFYLHYTVSPPYAKARMDRVAGPYNEYEILDQRHDLAAFVGISDVFISDSPQHQQWAIA